MKRLCSTEGNQKGTGMLNKGAGTRSERPGRQAALPRRQITRPASLPVQLLRLGHACLHLHVCPALRGGRQVPAVAQAPSFWV